MEKKYVIVSAYQFDDKKSNEKKYCIAGLLQTTKFPVKDTRKFFFSEEEFKSVLWDYEVDLEAYDLGLKGLNLVVVEQYSLSEDDE